MTAIETVPFQSEILGRRRNLRIWRPNADGARPLLIQQDGQTAFTDRDKDLPFGAWRLDQRAAELAAEGRIDPPIIVAIDNSPQRRREYFPLFEEYARYRDFLTEELLPWIEDHLAVTHDVARRALMGSSMGGLVSFALAVELPAHFGAAACLSPWFEAENFAYIHDRLRTLREKPAARLYMDSGIRDWRGLDDGHRGMLLARNELLRLGYEEGMDLVTHVDTWFPTADDLRGSAVKEGKFAEAAVNQHNEFQWNRRLHRPLEFLFGHR